MRVNDSNYVVKLWDIKDHSEEVDVKVFDLSEASPLFKRPEIERSLHLPTVRNWEIVTSFRLPLAIGELIDHTSTFTASPSGRRYVIVDPREIRPGDIILRIGL